VKSKHTKNIEWYVDKQDLVAKSVGITTGGELAEVHQSLFLGIGGQLVRQSDQNAYGQRRDQSQHKENDLVVYIYSSIYYDLGSVGGTTDYLVPNGQSMPRDVQTTFFYQRIIIAARHHIRQIFARLFRPLALEWFSRLSVCFGRFFLFN